MRYKFKIRGKNGIPNPFKGIEIKYADTPIVGELKVNKEGKIYGFRAKHQVLDYNDKKLIIGPRKGFPQYVNSKLTESCMNPVTEKEILENKFDLMTYDYKKDIEYFSPTISSLRWINEEKREISLKMYMNNDNNLQRKLRKNYGGLFV